MCAVGAGLALAGKIPFVASFSAFAINKGFEQLRCCVAYPKVNLKVVGTHSGISIGEDGPSQMGIEDVALARSFPGMTVIVPCDAPSTKKATAAMIEQRGPMYLRLGRPKVPVVYTDGCNFEIGKANTVREGTDVTVIANGLMVAMALDAAKELGDSGISVRVLDMHTAKPLDEEAIVKAARETGALVVAEEHLAAGGLGSAVAMIVGQTIPVPMAYVNLGDRYAESGDPEGLLEKYGLTSSAIVEAVRRVVRR